MPHAHHRFANPPETVLSVARRFLASLIGTDRGDELVDMALVEACARGEHDLDPRLAALMPAADASLGFVNGAHRDDCTACSVH